MSDATTASAHDSGSVFRLIYRSHSLVADEERRTVLGEIFTTARRKNKRLDVTGALVISGDSFVQALEGEESVVRELYATISQDARHDHVSLVEEGMVAGRTFGRWAMAKVSEDGGADIRLMSNAQKGVIVAAPRPDPSVTPEQEVVLASMREALVLDTMET
jgi:Sensors of blue-light using FAD